MADASGVNALERFLKRCRTHNVTVVFSELRPNVHAALRKLGVLDRVEIAETYDEAITLAAVAAEKS
jgi:anti-anti-sigma regulatory factor